MNPAKRQISDEVLAITTSSTASSKTSSEACDTSATEGLPLLARLCAGWLAGKFKQAGVSALQLSIMGSKPVTLGTFDGSKAVPSIRLINPWAVINGSRRGLIGWAETYMAEDWDTPDIRQVTEWAMQNESRLEQVFEPSWLSQKFNRLLHRLNDNTKRGSRKNIEAHYDLGNSFYKLWLDPSMTYSSALYKNGEDTLEQAQLNKYNAILDWLEIEQHHNLLEIGCGWGGLADVLSERELGSYHGVTLSHEQLAWSKDRLADQSKFAFSLTDYRDVKSQYDRIASVEMIEAVGEAHWPVYFQKIYDSLKPGGIAVLQVITIDDERFESYREGADFIQKYIFPGGMLPSHKIMQEQISKAGLVMDNTLAFGRDYARTLVEWYVRFNSAWPTIQKQGFDERFRRMWNYYLAYCEAGFNGDSIDVRLYKLQKPL